MLTEQERKWGQLAEKATPEPWVLGGDGIEESGSVDNPGFPGGILFESEQPENPEFVAVARTAVPELLKRLEAEREKVEMLRGILRKHRQGYVNLVEFGILEDEYADVSMTLIADANKALAASAGPEAAEKGAS